MRHYHPSIAVKLVPALPNAPSLNWLSHCLVVLVVLIVLVVPVLVGVYCLLMFDIIGLYVDDVIIRFIFIVTAVAVLLHDI